VTRPLILVISIALFVITAHQLPAPIQEVPESQPPGPEQSAKPKPKPKPLPKPQSRSEAGESATNPVRQQPSSKRSRFAGTWVGTMPEVPWGNVATELIVDHTEKTMEWQESGKRKGVANAQLTGSTLQARFPAGITIATWSIDPQSDGTTARVRLQAFMNDQTAVFRRIAAESRAVKPAR
jgi:hypothetical protein